MRWVLFPLLAAAGVLVPQERAAEPPAPVQATAPADTPPPAQTAIPRVTPTIVARYPHDTAAFTEGLVWLDGQLAESVGREGMSDVRLVDLASGKVTRRAAIPPGQFGEGLAIWRNTLVSLTWHDGIAYRWTAKTLKKTGTARYQGEGWGLTSDGHSLIRSDGSSTLTFHDPVTLAVQRQLPVTINGRAIDQLNELEWVDGTILANVWHTPFILRIDPATGRVTQAIDLSALVAEVGARDIEAVPNGIAWDAEKRRLFVTGKLWPTVFEISLPAS